MGTTVLVVDRSEDFVDLMEMVLGEEGYIVISCSDPASAYDNALRFQPQVAIIDLALPGHGGWELIRRLRTNAEIAQLHIIVCSAAATELDRRSNTVRQLGLRVLPKPFDLSDLLELLWSLPVRCVKPYRLTAPDE